MTEYVIVPVEPTQEMLDAGYYPASQGRGCESVWQSMIKAAPKQEADPENLRFTSACELDGPKHPEYVKGWESAMDAVCKSMDEVKPRAWEDDEGCLHTTFESATFSSKHVTPLYTARLPAQAHICSWTVYDADFGVWDTGCGKSYQLTEGTLEGNEIKFCPFCGGQLTVLIR